MFELDPQVVVGDGEDCQSFVADVAGLPLPDPGEASLQEFVLEEDDREHDVLKGVLVAVELTEHGAEVEVGVGEGAGLFYFELYFQGLDEVGEGRSHFASAAVVAGEVVIGGGLEL